MILCVLLAADKKELKQLQDKVALSLAAASQACARADKSEEGSRAGEDPSNCSNAVNEKKNRKRKKSSPNGKCNVWIGVYGLISFGKLLQ